MSIGPAAADALGNAGDEVSVATVDVSSREAAEMLDGKVAEWMEHVTDEQYSRELVRGGEDRRNQNASDCDVWRGRYLAYQSNEPGALLPRWRW
jgi:hypothetical protein